MKLAVSWSGGMESNLALYKARNEGHEIAYLVVFVSKTWPSFCHPITIMEKQAKAVEIPLLKLRVQEPYEQSYHEAIKKLVDMGIEGIVTGDIYVVDDFHGLWMDKVTKGLDIKVIMPLWEMETSKVLNEEISSGFKSVFTCLTKEFFTKDWLGKELNTASVTELKMYAKKKGFDPCGENGEYHTMVIDGPIYNQSIKISEITREETETRLFTKINKCGLKPKK